MGYNLKSIREKFKKQGIFYTEKKLALFLKGFLENQEPLEVYDPTCGNGGLLSVFNDDVKKYGQEIDKEQLEDAKKRLVNFNGVCGDTLKDPAFLGKKFKTIVANYPFSISWEPKEDERFNIGVLPPKSKADFAFLLHILHYLDEEGEAVVLNFPGILYRGNREGKIRKWFVENNYIKKIVRVKEKSFVDTKIETVLIVLAKNKKNTDIEFIDSERSRFVGVEEIKENDYNLSINTYLPVIIERPIYNPLELQKQARKNFILALKSELKIDKMVCALENISHDDFLNDIKKVIMEGV
ncbi:MAG: N-6 DNA methylase [Acutalibacteraceae bacterium]